MPDGQEDGPAEGEPGQGGDPAKDFLTAQKNYNETSAKW